METRRLRLILIACLRGLLTEVSTDRDIKTAFRKEYVLEHLQVELDASAEVDRIHLELTAMSHIKPVQVASMISKARRRHRILNRIMELDMSVLNETENDKVDALIQIYQALERAGIITQPAEEKEKTNG